MSILTDIHLANPGSLITLFELDTSELDAINSGGTYTGVSKYYFHNGVNQYGNDVIWQGNLYSRLPVQASGFEMNTKGTLPKPILKISNLFFAITSLIQQKGDLVGAKLIRRRTLHRYLDAINFQRGGYLQWKNTADSVTVDSSGLNAYQTGGIGVEPICSPSYLNSATLPGAFYWEVTINNIGAGAGAEVQIGISSNNTSSQVYASSSIYGRGYRSSDGRKVYNNSALDYGVGYGEGDTIGVVYDNNTGNIYFYKNGVSVQFDIDSVTPLAAFIGVSGSTGAIDTSVNWYPVVDIAGGTATTTDITINYGATNFLYGPPTDIPGKVSGDFLTIYGNKLADANAHFPDDVFFINRKGLENNTTVEYELSTALDVQSIKLPRRQIIQNTCLWRYRGGECGYSVDSTYNEVTRQVEYSTNPSATNKYYDSFDNEIVVADTSSVEQKVAALKMDRCSKKLSGCKLRFTSKLPYGGFPGAVVQ